MEYQRKSTPEGDLIIELNGELDALGAVEIRPVLEDVVDEKQAENVSLDLSDVSFLDSSGIGAIVFLYKRLKTTGRNLELTGVRGQPRELMELLRIHKAIPVSWNSDVNIAAA